MFGNASLNCCNNCSRFFQLQTDERQKKYINKTVKYCKYEFPVKYFYWFLCIKFSNILLFLCEEEKLLLKFNISIKLCDSYKFLLKDINNRYEKQWLFEMNFFYIFFCVRGNFMKIFYKMKILLKKIHKNKIL